MVQATIVVLCGVPGAGKTTLAKWLERAAPDRVVRLCFDEYASQWAYPQQTDGTVSSLPDTPLKTARAAWVQDARLKVRGLLAGHGGPDGHLLVVVDDTNSHKSMRHPWAELAIQEGLGFAQVLLQVPVAVAQQRCVDRGTTGLDGTVVRMDADLAAAAAAWTVGNKADGVDGNMQASAARGWDSFGLVVDATRLAVGPMAEGSGSIQGAMQAPEAVLARVMRLSQSFVQWRALCGQQDMQRGQDRRRTKESVLHQANLRLAVLAGALCRKHMDSLIDDKQRREFGKSVAATKRSVMARFAHGVFNDDELERVFVREVEQELEGIKGTAAIAQKGQERMAQFM
ncbi:hypothetical protein BC831DRAFT_253493 [Entophlyctis helioformis]|nr:hypothetical protein BC831DRAFT_253493 [Entophlyctis helioformis]